MAWDKNRPYLPVDEDGHSMLHSSFNPTKGDIDRIYETGGCEFVDRYGHVKRFVLFREVRLKLRPTGLCRGRSAMGVEWYDGNDYYYMFAESFNNLVKEHHEYSVPIDGYWSAEKRGEKYGIKLVKMAKEEQCRCADGASMVLP